MKKLIEYVDLMNYKRIMIGHRPDNLTAGELYESLGFKRVSEELVDGEIICLLQLS